MEPTPSAQMLKALDASVITPASSGNCPTLNDFSELLLPSPQEFWAYTLKV